VVINLEKFAGGGADVRRQLKQRLKVVGEELFRASNRVD
jgi:hypothetical protein